MGVAFIIYFPYKKEKNYFFETETLSVSSSTLQFLNPVTCAHAALYEQMSLQETPVQNLYISSVQFQRGD
jgi:hypothetical protein